MVEVLRRLNVGEDRTNHAKARAVRPFSGHLSELSSFVIFSNLGRESAPGCFATSSLAGIQQALRKVVAPSFLAVSKVNGSAACIHILILNLNWKPAGSHTVTKGPSTE